MEILKTKGISDQEVDGIITPLKEIHLLRTKFKGHSSGNESDSIRKRLIAQHTNLKNHFRHLIDCTNKSIKALLEII